MGRRIVVGFAAALVATALVAAGRTPVAVADDRPGAWTAYAESSGIRASVLKPAGLPTSDEIAGLSIPFARTETDSSPIARAVASWLWPGEGIADVKSLLLVGLDPSAAQGESEQRKKRHPGTNGCQAERVLATPEVQDPSSGAVLVPATAITNPTNGQPVYDPTDNPCGEASARIALQTLVRERVPAYPFWAHAAWPPNRSADTHDRQTLCTASAAFPREWELPASTCPAGADAARTGFADASSNESGSWSTAQLTNVTVPGVLSARVVTSLARTEWRGATLVASTSVTIGDLSILGAGGAELIHVDALVAQATAASAGAAPASTLHATGVTVTLGGTTYRAAIERGRVRVADQRLPNAAETQLNAALDLATASQSQRIAFGDADGEARGSATAVAERADDAQRSASVTALTVELGGSDSLQGTSTLRLSLGVADVAAITRTSAAGGFVPPPEFDFGGGDPSGAPVVDPGLVASPPFTSGPNAVPPGSAPRSLALADPASEPVPVGVVVVAMLAVILAAGAMVAAGIWETVT